ncbi:MAG: hypothetical protein JXR95_05305 [Deltaproteobacteria bacterium]|nr:hypothetical protein [Deltaproteobacteria bacterium]
MKPVLIDDKDGTLDATEVDNTSYVCNGNPGQFSFKTSQIIEGKTVTCTSVDTNETYTECQNLTVEDLYFPNGVTCGPIWSTTESHFTRHANFCYYLTGSSTFEVYYACDSSIPRATWFGTTWGSNTNDNGFTQHIRCYY